jgi:hypothetical protein
MNAVQKLADSFWIQLATVTSSDMIDTTNGRLAIDVPPIDLYNPDHELYQNSEMIDNLVREIAGELQDDQYCITDMTDSELGFLASGAANESIREIVMDALIELESLLKANGQDHDDQDLFIYLEAGFDHD